MSIPHPIPYQGSKRNISDSILAFFPNDIGYLIEPFSGSAAISIAAAYHKKAAYFYLNDINKPLIRLLEQMINNPLKISGEYEKLWNSQKNIEKEFYLNTRNEFNETKNSACLLYLLARCVKASVRYNSKGEFNQSPDNRRLGKSPHNMRRDIFAVSKLLKGRTQLSCKDYKDILKHISKDDIVYMDPPYQGVCQNRDSRYYNSIDFNELVLELKDLVYDNISFILSYDGRRGNKSYGCELPKSLGLRRIEINAGRSTQATLLGMNDITYESVYLSPALISRLQVPSNRLTDKLSNPIALSNYQ